MNGFRPQRSIEDLSRLNRDMKTYNLGKSGALRRGEPLGHIITCDERYILIDLLGVRCIGFERSKMLVVNKSENFPTYKLVLG